MTRNLGRVKAQGFQRLGRWRVGWRGRGAEGLMFCVAGGGITKDVYGGRGLVTCGDLLLLRPRAGRPFAEG